MLKLFLFLSLFVFFYLITGGEVPDESKLKYYAKNYLIPGISAFLFFLFFTMFLKTPLSGLVWAVLGWHVPGSVMQYVKLRKKKMIREQIKNFVASSAGLFAVGMTAPEVLRISADTIGEPLKTEFKNMIAARNLNPQASIPRMFKDLAQKYELSEFEAVSSIIAASEKAGGPQAVSKGMKRLGSALRQRDRLAAEREKAVIEPKIAAYVVIFLLVLGIFVDGLFLSRYFETFAGRIVLFVNSAMTVGLIFLARRVLATQNDLS